MAIENRDLAPSLQVRTVDRNFAAVATGVTAIVCMAEAPCQIIGGALKAYGLSGVPVWSLQILRSTTGGLTLLGLGATITIADGATFAQGISFSLGGTSSLFMQTGDQLVVTTSVANTSITQGQLTVGLRLTQDVKTFFGVNLG